MTTDDDVTIAICDICRLAEPIPNQEYAAWLREHDHREPDE